MNRGSRFRLGVSIPVDSLLDTTAGRIAERLYDNPALWSSKTKVAALIAIELREYTEALEERYPLTALVIFGASLAAGLILGFVAGNLFGYDMLSGGK